MPSRRDPQRDLLAGLLAIQNGLVDQAQLVAAFAAWTADGARPTVEILEERGLIDAARRALLEALADAHLKLHGGDTEKSLAAVQAGPEVRQSLDALGDTDLTSSLAAVCSPPTQNGSDAEATTAFAVGSSTSDGQRFRVVRAHAQGGLGAVFVAIDGELHREVALKRILERHADDATSRQRFLIEAEITGGLEHPGIVPVYGLGTHDDGRPYYAMRFIRGDSLKEAIDRFHKDETLKRDPGMRSLELRKLIRRFVDVCNAIEYAHGRGILHRDIKPSNVIVGKYGETLVVDWGLAKPIGKSEKSPIMDGERTLVPSSASGSEDTLPGSTLGTPAYMSPEQAAGDLDRLGPRSDVYSLGATLYCLLTGRSPMDGLDIVTALRAVQKGEFPPPRKVSPEVSKPLEAICLEAMALKPEDRYASSRALADDLERWMADEPVLAYPEPWTTKTRRWVGRNRTAVVAGVSTLVVAIAGLIALSVVQQRANLELLAAVERERAARVKSSARFNMATEAVEAFYTGVSGDVLLGQPQLFELRSKLLQTSLKFYRRWQADLEAGTELSEAEQHSLALSYDRIAEIQVLIGAKDDALKTYEKILEFTKSKESPSIVSGMHGKIFLKMARVQRELGRSAEALLLYRRSLGALEKFDGVDSVHTGDLGWCLFTFGSFLDEQGHPEEALRMLERARNVNERRARASTWEAWVRHNLAGTYMTLGNVHVEHDRLDEARRCYEQARSILEKLAADDKSNNDYKSDLARSFNNLGFERAEANQPSQALEWIEQGRRIREDLFAAQPLNIGFRSDLGRSYYYRALVRVRTGPTAEALADLKRAEELFEGLPVVVPENRFYQACLLALHTHPIGPNPSPPSPEEQADRHRFADLAMQALKKAVDGGFKKREVLKRHWVWEPFRSRPDFQSLIQKLEEDAKSFSVEGKVKEGPKASPG